MDAGLDRDHGPFEDLRVMRRERAERPSGVVRRLTAARRADVLALDWALRRRAGAFFDDPYRPLARSQFRVFFGVVEGVGRDSDGRDRFAVGGSAPDAAP